MFRVQPTLSSRTYASPLTEQRRVCRSVAPAGWCGLLAPESRVKEAATWCQVAARITVTAATTGQLDTCTACTVYTAHQAEWTM